MEDQHGATSPAAIAPPRYRRRRYAALLPVPPVGLLVWAERRPIATRFIDRHLDSVRVPARYAIADLGFGRQRLTGVVLGDPADPDLTADWVETRIAFGLGGPYVASLSAGGVRIKARMVNERISLGTVDRLLPPPSGKPFALPSLPVTVQDAQIRLATPYGMLLLAVAGEGRLNDGFRGPLAIVAPHLAARGCSLAGLRGAMTVSIADGQPHFDGPIGAAALDCAAVQATRPQAAVDMTFGAALDRWKGEADFAADRLALPQARLAGMSGRIDFAGSAQATRGGVAVNARQAVAIPAAVSGSARVAGDFVLGRAPHFGGTVALSDAALAEGWRARFAGLAAPGGANPLAPLLDRLTRAVSAASRRFDVEAELDIAKGRVATDRVVLAARSGATASFDGSLAVTAAGIQANGALAVGGGGLPGIQARLTQHAPDGAITGRAEVAPYAATAARLALAPVDFAISPAGAMRLATRARLSGPLGDGRIEALTLPLTIRRTGDGTVTVNPGCRPVAFRSLAVAGLDLDPVATSLCATGGALIAVDRGRLSGGARLPAARLSGRLGSTPLSIVAGGASLRLAGRDFVVDRVEALIGAPERRTRLAAERLTGTIAGSAVRGGFAGAAGQIANVPLLLSNGEGRWRLFEGRLSLDGSLKVADAATAAPRFLPMDARGVGLTLENGRIRAAGVLHEPGTGTRVADVTIAHDLSAGRGHADLVVPGIAFGKDFQPNLITPLTFGVIADVRGSVDGAGHIDWSPQGVSSTGDFGTVAGSPGLDLAAAFGPAQGIAGRVRFDDLLALHTPPGQVATVRVVNPGVEVQDGTIRYQLLGGTRVRIEGAEWPFAGGRLTLDPTLLDFDAARERRLTFRIAGARADQFLQQFDFANLNATGTFDGELPMIFDQSGGRIRDGRLAMRAGGGTIAYVGTLGQQQLGAWGNLAFQALRSLRYRSMDLAINGPLSGEMVTDVRFAGVSQGQGAKSNFLIRRLQRLPFVFNVRIRAPFRGLIDSVTSLYDPRRLDQGKLRDLIDRERGTTRPTAPTIQPPASETVR